MYVAVPHPVKVKVSLKPSMSFPAGVGVVEPDFEKTVVTVPDVGVQHPELNVTPLKAVVPRTFIRL